MKNQSELSGLQGGSQAPTRLQIRSLKSRPSARPDPRPNGHRINLTGSPPQRAIDASTARGASRSDNPAFGQNTRAACKQSNPRPYASPTRTRAFRPGHSSWVATLMTGRTAPHPIGVSGHPPQTVRKSAPTVAPTPAHSARMPPIPGDLESQQRVDPASSSNADTPRDPLTAAR